ncbi:glycosyltransferase family 9 protein [Bradyrhizobium sp. Tv2a-2]|uniref:glycosyltransferase family 9 protein n=1 Tax=Bradyrhizobium sp. Tv2a-2 TaxID=113395 RepID=UPI0012EC08EF|nr:glycosyltransferase family 9 protein [Bradyrhizobium sp. Tv2a-2]
MDFAKSSGLQIKSGAPTTPQRILTDNSHAVTDEPEHELHGTNETTALDRDVDQGSSASVGILNGFGRTLGDSIIGLQALSVAVRIRAIPAPATLFRLPYLPTMVQAIYEAAEFVRIKTLPWHFATKERHFDHHGSYARVIDLRNYAFDLDFQRTSMIDFFFRRLGVPSSSISTADKRNAWLSPRVVSAEPLFPSGYILVCPNSSTPLRNMPPAVHELILQEALAVGPVVTQGQVPDKLCNRVIRALPCKTLGDLCGLVRHAKLIISTDTAMVHLADAFDVPCLAFFPTHLPKWRVRDYPNCRAVMLRSELPPGLEFARVSGDEELAQAGWFSDNGDLGWLTDVLKPSLEAT